tara:strand:- start:461 stop:1093 length:633 start_codon:yes stop_codon:yes gene_type:complete
MENIFSKIKQQLLQSLDSDIILSSSFVDKHNSKSYTLVKNFKKAAVLCLLDYNDQDLTIILTLRSKKLKDHPGQISFPGGKVNNKENLFDCALRETNEEIGLKSKNINVLGELNMYLSGSNFLIKPIVGYTDGRFRVSLNKDEVDRVIYFPISYLFNNRNLTKSSYIDKSSNTKKFYYDIYWHDMRIWGTTAIILVHLSKIINSVILKDV